MIRVIELIVSVSFYIEILKKIIGLFLRGGTGLEKSKDDSARNGSNSLVAHVELVTVLYLFLKNILGQKVALSPLVLCYSYSSSIALVWMSIIFLVCFLYPRRFASLWEISSSFFIKKLQEEVISCSNFEIEVSQDLNTGKFFKLFH